jgi:hypothetical protein
VTWADPTPQSQPVDISKATQDVIANDDGTVTLNAVMYDAEGSSVTVISQKTSVQSIMFKINTLTLQMKNAQGQLDQLNALLPTVQKAQDDAITKIQGKIATP